MPKLAPETPEMVSTSQAARLLGCHVRTVHRLVESGRLKPVAKVPGRTGAYLFLRIDVAAVAKDAA